MQRHGPAGASAAVPPTVPRCDYWLKSPEAANRKGSYAFDGKTFLTGAVGQRIGEKVYACVYDGVHVIEAGACTKYTERFGEWTNAPGACRSGADGAIGIDDGGSTYRLVPRGEAYVEESGWQGKVERLPDLASDLERVKAPRSYTLQPGRMRVFRGLLSPLRASSRPASPSRAPPRTAS